MSFVGLEKCDGPECPACGCRDTEERTGKGRWGLPSTRMVCRNCRYEWIEPTQTKGNGQERPPPPPPPQQPPPPPVPQPGGVIFRPVRCPECQSADIRVTSSRRPIRHHKCKACGHNFKSVEESQPEVT